MFPWSGGSYSATATSDQRFVYDGWNVVGVFDSSFQLLSSYIWGLDLSGTAQGAGGVGGLLAGLAGTTAQFAAYDGNGNVRALADGATGAWSAQYEHGPFGELIRATGPQARANPFRFSTKWHDNDTDLLYYGYRYYQPGTGRWLSRDPIEESGGPNLHGFVASNPIQVIDRWGLDLYRYITDPIVGHECVIIGNPADGCMMAQLGAGNSSGVFKLVGPVDISVSMMPPNVNLEEPDPGFKPRLFCRRIRTSCQTDRDLHRYLKRLQERNFRWPFYIVGSNCGHFVDHLTSRAIITEYINSIGK